MNGRGRQETENIRCRTTDVTFDKGRTAAREKSLKDTVRDKHGTPSSNRVKLKKRRHPRRKTGEGGGTKQPTSGQNFCEGEIETR